MWPFLKAVFLGAIASAAAPMIFTMGLAVSTLPEWVSGDSSIWRAAYLVFLPLIVALPVVLAASIAVGLPLTLAFKRWGCESQGTYVAAGVLTGALIPLVVLSLNRAPDGYWMALLGAFGGGITGKVWWDRPTADIKP